MEYRHIVRVNSVTHNFFKIHMFVMNHNIKCISYCRSHKKMLESHDFNMLDSCSRTLCPSNGSTSMHKGPEKEVQDPMILRGSGSGGVDFDDRNKGIKNCLSHAELISFLESS